MYFFSYELWNVLWENCSSEDAFVEALSDAVVRGELANFAPSPDFTQVQSPMQKEMFVFLFLDEIFWIVFIVKDVYDFKYYLMQIVLIYNDHDF